ncbi:lipase/ esterase [Dichomitus squalens]|nr:lipase/ esterase [Dichomitus squalens LYAD-421 SS1]EJF66756.1 lipase/ esterase [Dichomitus squalens LYAD-421 SS1]TBU35318.1 lipase/ esterase [Dichomitus squalens]TBU45089.1 lipase/ esterase [Dichomitus squalens]
MASERPVLQPIHPQTEARLLKEYADFHRQHIQHTPFLHDLPWDPAVRAAPAVQGGSEPLPVGNVQDYALSKFSVRVFTPEGDAPEGGWPVFIFFHGGGWTLGRIDTENSFSSNMCKRANTVVVSVDYRLGPENPYPAAVEDTVESLQWVYNKGKELLGVNPSRIAVGGSSSGGNLAAIATHKAAELGIPVVFQLLVVPVVDNTAQVDDDRYPSWKENERTVALVPGRMLWFRDNYTPNPEDHTKWDNSPIFAPEELFKKSPPAWIGVAELDILRDEGIAYGEKLTKAGIPAEVKVYKGAPHPIMAMDG